MEFLDQVGCYLSKSTLDGRTISEKVLGQTHDISIFKLAWFQPIWYYDPDLSFPQDKMNPGFFLKLAENTGNGFAYVVLPAKTVEYIPRRRNPVTLVRSVVRSMDLSSSNVSRCIKDVAIFKFMNADGDELFVDTESSDLAKKELEDEEMATTGLSNSEE